MSSATSRFGMKAMICPSTSLTAVMPTALAAITTKISRTYQVMMPPTRPGASSLSFARCRKAVMPAFVASWSTPILRSSRATSPPTNPATIQPMTSSRSAPTIDGSATRKAVSIVFTASMVKTPQRNIGTRWEHSRGLTAWRVKAQSCARVTAIRQVGVGSRLGGAGAGDRRPRHLDRRAETDDGAHPVGGPPVPSEPLWTQKLDAGEEVEGAHGVAHVRQRARDAAVLDQERAVARRPGHRGALGIRRVGVVKARDEHTALHRADELLALRVAARHREIARVAAHAVAAGTGGVAGRARVEPLRRLAIVHHALRDAGLDERDPLLRRPLNVERDRERARVERVVPEREAWTGDLLAEMSGHERAAVLQRLAGQTRERHEAQDLRDRELLEYRFVVARRKLRSVAIEGRLLDGTRGDL